MKHTEKPTNPQHRLVLAGSASAVAVAGLTRLNRAHAAGDAATAVTPAAGAAAKPLPAYVAWKDPRAMIIHTSSTLETK